MIEKLFFFCMFLICAGMLANMASRGALFRWARRVWAAVRDLPAARRRRAYLENEFRLTRERQSHSRSRSTLDH
jgi:hypothetical protein